MTNAVLTSGDELIKQAGIEGIGSRTADRLEAVGISSVVQLADADAGQLADTLSRSYSQLKLATLRQKVDQWVSLARERVRRDAGLSTRGHVFLLTLWADSDGRPVRSRFGYRSPDEPTSDETSIEMMGWSPVAFAGFVERAARLSLAHDLTEERVEPTEVVEWSKHEVHGDLIKGGAAPVEVRARVPTEQLDVERGWIRWRAAGRLVPFGGGPQIGLGSCAGTVEPGAPIELEFGAHLVPDHLHRLWFHLAVSPPAAPEDVPRSIGDMPDDEGEPRDRTRPGDGV